MTRPRLIFLLVAAGLAGFTILWPSRDLSDSGKTEPTPPSAPPPAAVPNPLVQGFDGLARPSSRPESLQMLRDLKDKLISLPRAEALAVIREFIATGSDRPTGLSFEIGEGGNLTEWPAFRVFLLEILPAIDPAAAAELSRQILAAPTLADEWAVALRNVARTDSSPETNEWLRGKTEVLINHPPWQAAPSIGYLNAFDVLVHINATRSLPLLSSLIQRKDRKDLAHAGFLTLDGLVRRNPVEALTILSSDTALQQSRPEMTAQEFARADLRDPGQQELIRQWLLNPGRTGTELNSFAGVFPNNNHFVSRNLLTTNTPVSGRNLAEYDSAAREILRGWHQSPEFQPVQSHLQTMLTRLEAFVAKPVPPVPSPSGQ